MSNQSTTDNFTQVIREIQKRSAVDAGFRSLALKNPAAAFEAVAGVALPTDAKLRFVNQLEEIVVLLPPLGEPELSDAELSQASGGLVYTPSTLGALGGQGCAS